MTRGEKAFRISEWICFLSFFLLSAPYLNVMWRRWLPASLEHGCQEILQIRLVA